MYVCFWYPSGLKWNGKYILLCFRITARYHLFSMLEEINQFPGGSSINSA